MQRYAAGRSMRSFVTDPYCLNRSGTVCRAASTPVADTEWEALPLPEGDLGLPIVGQTFEWLRHYIDFYKTRYCTPETICKLERLPP